MKSKSKKYITSLSYQSSVALVPARTDTIWFSRLFAHASSVKFIRGRLHFNDDKNSAPFPSCLVYLYLGNIHPNVYIIDKADIC